MLLFLYMSFLVTFSYVLTKNINQRIQNLPPSPFISLPIIGHLYLFINKPLASTFTKLSKVYGSIMLLNLGSLTVLVVSSPSTAEECFRKNDHIFANRPNSLIGRVLGYDNTSLLVAPYGPHWRNLRKIFYSDFLVPHLHLHHLSNVRHDEVKSLIQRLYAKQSLDSEGWHNLDMKDVLFEFLYNVITRMTMGDDSYNLDNEKGKTLINVMKDIFRLTELPVLKDFMPLLRKIGVESNVEKKVKQVHKKVDAILEKMIEQQQSKECDDKEEGKMICNNGGLIEVLLSLQHKDPKIYTNEIIKGFILVLLLAGMETTSTTLIWALTLLVNNPTKLLKAQNEIDEHVGPNHLVNESNLSQLPYLHSIIIETLRMQPTAPLLLPHETTSDCVVNGYNVPRGTMLLANVWAIHNDPKIWPDPRCFKPERFEGVKGNRVGFELMPFGSGRRSCPGEDLSMRIIGVTLGALIQCFELERTSQDMIDTQAMPTITLVKINPLRIKLRPRLAMLKLISQI